jgi:RNA polymerase sigma-70 factor (ECF subfamily)
MRYANVIAAVAGTARKTRAAARWDIEHDDDQVIRSVRNGDSEAFGNLVRKYEDFVFTLIRGLAESEDDARDITQETFLRAYRGIRRFQFKSTFKTWLYRIAYNTAMSHLARGRSHRLSIQETEPILWDDPQVRHSLRLTVEKLIGRLKPDLKAVIILYYYDDLKYEQIAEIMDCPVNTVKIRLYRAKYELGRLWEKYAV